MNKVYRLEQINTVSAWSLLHLVWSKGTNKLQVNAQLIRY